MLNFLNKINNEPNTTWVQFSSTEQFESAHRARMIKTIKFISADGWQSELNHCELPLNELVDLVRNNYKAGAITYVKLIDNASIKEA